MEKKNKKIVDSVEDSNDFFYKAGESFVKATGILQVIIDEDGCVKDVLHRLTAADKWVYCMMRHRYLAFKEANNTLDAPIRKPEGKFYYDNQSDIAERLGLDRKTVNTTIEKLASLGVIKKYFKNVGNGNANNVKSLSYTVLDILSVDGVKCFYEKDIGAGVVERKFFKKPPATPVGHVVEKISYIKPQPIKPVHKNSWIEEDGPECPF